MRFFKDIFLLVLIACISSCGSPKTKIEVVNQPDNIATDLQLDHFNIWVKNPKKAKKKLVDLGFISVPDSLSQIHHGQGTAGKYFYFLNGYLELIYAHDEEELQENSNKNPGLDFAERANFSKNGASPFSLALKVKDYDTSKIPFDKIAYRQDWMEEHVKIYVAKQSKLNLQEPSIFVVYPEIESDRFETLSDLKAIPEEHAIWREFFKHSNGAKLVTKVSITSNKLNTNSKTINAVNAIENVQVKNGTEHLMELHFDNATQGKTFDLRPELPLIIRL